MKRTSTVVVVFGLLAGGCAGLNEDVLRQAAGVMQPQPVAESEIAGALKDALAQGVGAAIGSLGRSNGFWGNLAVRVPLPAPLAKAEPTLRKLGMGARLDEFHLALNRAAEQATPQVAGAFGDAIREMSLDDARAILDGGEDAATQYFRRAAGPSLAALIRPTVEATTRNVGVTQKYKALMSDYGPILARAGVGDTDLDTLVTDRTVDGIFYAVAAEEARIRRDPRARTTELMRRVFGNL